MNFKKFLLLCLLLAVTVSSLSVASAAFLDSMGVTSFSEDTNITLDGFSFNIPAGYGEYSDINKDGEIEGGVTTYSRSYFNEDADLISINIIYNDKYLSLSDLKDDSEVEKTIAGIDGLFDDRDADDDIYYFTYIQDNKIILISAPNETTIAQIIN